MRRRDIIRAIRSIEVARNKIDLMNKKYPIMYRDSLQSVGNRTINQWYATYSPIFYRRTNSLYEAFKIIVNGTNYNVEFNPSFIEGFHGEKSEYLYDLVFIHGYHGGDIAGDNHPSPGIPWWRTPYPQLTEWGRPALRSFSPYNRMIREMQNEIKRIDKIKQEEYDKIIANVEKAIIRLI